MSYFILNKFFVIIDIFSFKLSFSVLSMLETTAFFLKYFSFEGKKGKSGVRRKVYQASINKALFCLCLFKISVCPNVLEYLPLLHAEGIIFVMGRWSSEDFLSITIIFWFFFFWINIYTCVYLKYLNCQSKAFQFQLKIQSPLKYSFCDLFKSIIK